MSTREKYSFRFGASLHEDAILGTFWKVQTQRIITSEQSFHNRRNGFVNIETENGYELLLLTKQFFIYKY